MNAMQDELFQGEVYIMEAKRELPPPSLSPFLPLSLSPSLPPSLPPSLSLSLPPSLPLSLPPSLPPSLHREVCWA